MKFEEKLAQLRKEHGMTQLDLAEALNVSRQTISKWERGVVIPSTENLMYIGKLFDVPVDELVNEDVLFQKRSAAAVAVVEEPDITHHPKGTSLPKIARNVVLVACILLMTIVSLIIHTTLSKEPAESIVWMEEAKYERVDISSAGNLIREP